MVELISLSRYLEETVLSNIITTNYYSPMEVLNHLVTRGLLALGLGLIIGFQRERKLSSTAGIRTFPLFALIGFFCALIENTGMSWIVAAGLLAVAAILYRTAGHESGVTTEMAGLLVYLIGAYLAVGRRVELAVITGGVCAILLYLKETMHKWVEHLNSYEVRGIMQFVLIALVIFPLLPDRTFDDLDVLNPRQIWLMVVLITGISLGSFSIQKIKGPRVGSVLAGIFGGLISSTATTITMARLSKKISIQGSLVPAVLIASTTAFLRILGEVLIVAPGSFWPIATPLVTLFVFMVIQCLYSLSQVSKNEASAKNVDTQDPSQLKAALIFGLLYAAIVYASAWSRFNYGQQGLYFVSLLSGLIDVDAITISTSHLLREGKIDLLTGWRSILIAFLSNLGFKSVMVFFIADNNLKKKIGIHFSIAMLVGFLILIFWPES